MYLDKFWYLVFHPPLFSLRGHLDKQRDPFTLLPAGEKVLWIIPGPSYITPGADLNARVETAVVVMKMMCFFLGGGVGGAPLLEANIMTLTTGVCTPCPVETLHSDRKPLIPPPCLHQVAVSYCAPCKPHSPYGNPDHCL